MSNDIQKASDAITIEIDGELAKVPFEMTAGVPTVSTADAGLWLHSTDDPRSASKLVTQTIRRNEDLFESPEFANDFILRTELQNGRMAIRITQKGLMLLAMKTRSSIGRRFCVAAATAMKGIASGQSVKASAASSPQPAQPLALNDGVAEKLLDLVRTQLQRDSEKDLVINQLVNRIDALTGSVEQLKTKASTPIDLLPGERRAVSVARKAGWCSKKGKPHAQAVLVAAINNGLNTNNKCLRKATFLIETNSHGLRPQETLVFTEKGAALFLDEIESLYRGDSFTVRPNYIARQQGRSRDQHVVRGVCI